MILADSEIENAIRIKDIVIEPYNPACLGSNSYDVHLGSTLAIYDLSLLYTMINTDDQRIGICDGLDCKKEIELEYIEIPPEGFCLMPGILYLGVTQEYTECHKTVPFLEGKSSVGRLGLNIHATAGKGDVGFCGYWTLELSVIHPLRVYAGMPVGQLIFHSVLGKINNPYNQKSSAKYNNKREENPKPLGSKMFKNFEVKSDPVAFPSPDCTYWWYNAYSKKKEQNTWIGHINDLKLLRTGNCCETEEQLDKWLNKDYKDWYERIPGDLVVVYYNNSEGDIAVVQATQEGIDGKHYGGMATNLQALDYDREDYEEDVIPQGTFDGFHLHPVEIELRRLAIQSGEIGELWWAIEYLEGKLQSYAYEWKIVGAICFATQESATNAIQTVGEDKIIEYLKSK